MEFLPLQKGDVPVTFADNQDFFKEFDYMATMPFEEGVDCFVNWYRNYFKV